jgi:hypothetical protein
VSEKAEYATWIGITSCGKFFDPDRISYEQTFSAYLHSFKLLHLIYTTTTDYTKKIKHRDVINCTSPVNSILFEEKDNPKTLSWKQRIKQSRRFSTKIIE